MEFELSETQRMMQQAARSFLADRCPSQRVRELMDTPTAFDADLWREIAEQGWCAMLIPEQYDGLGLTPVEVAAVAEETGRACVPGPLFSHWVATAAGAAVEEPSETFKSWLPELAGGSRRATLALAEDELAATLDFGDVQTAASEQGGRLELNGRKLFVGDAETSDLLLVAARIENEPVLLAVPRETAGVQLRPLASVDATRKLYDVRFEGVTLAPQHALARGPAAEAALRSAVRLAIVALSAELVGGMQWVLETAVEYAKTRKQFGRPIGSFQAVQHQCADMLLWLESSRSATYYAAWAVAENEPVADEAVSIAKTYVSEAAREVGNRGVQVHGGIGFTWEHDMQLYYKRFTAAEHAWGRPAEHRHRLGQRLAQPAVAG